MDEWAEKCEPQGGSVFKKDDIGRRNGKAPNDKMAEMIKKNSGRGQTKDLQGLLRVKQNTNTHTNIYTHTHKYIHSNIHTHTTTH